MADTSSKTMDKKNVLFPEGGGHAKLAMWASVKGQLKTRLELLGGGDVSINVKAADDLVREAIATKDAAKDTYFKVGVIGTDLVLRVKTQQKGIAQILGYEQKDALLAKNFALKKAEDAPKAAKTTEEIKFPTFVALAPGDCKPIVTEYLDIGKGYNILLAVKVEGVDKDAGLRVRIERVHKEFCKEYQDKAKVIVDDVAVELSKLTVKSGRSLKEVAAKAEAELGKLFDSTAIGKAFEAAVLAMARADANLKQHVREWKIRGACKAITVTVKLATNILTLVASHGADVTAYRSIVKCGFDIYKLVSDFAKTEIAAAAELDKAIVLYRAASIDLLGALADVYALNKLASGAVLGTLKTLGDAATLAQDKVSQAIKTYTGKNVAQQPEDVRRRYLVELGKLLNALDAKVEEMTKAMNKFRDSSINAAVQAWPKLQALKKACADAADYLRARKDYARDAEARIATLGIKVDNSTTLEKLKKTVEGIREFNATKVIGGSIEVATMASSAKSAFEAVAALVTEVGSYV